MKKLFWSFFVTVCAVTAANAGKIYWVSPSGNDFPGWQGVATADKTFTTIKAALADGDLADGDTVVLDKCEFAMTYALWSGDNAGWEIKKSITLTGVGTREETIVSTDTNATRSAEVVGRSFAGNRFFPYFSLKAKGVKLQNMTFERLGADQQQVVVINNVADCVISNMVFRNTGWGYYSNPAKSLEKQPAMIDCGNQNTVISGCVVTNNCWAGTLFNFTGKYAVMENCHVAGNVYTGVGASKNLGLLYFCADYTKIRNNTFINNRTTGGVINNSNGKCDIANNIIRGNTLLDGTTMKNFWSIGTLSKYVYNCLESDGATVTGEGNIFAHPMFKDDNYNLRPASPCKGAGSSTYAPAIDIDGTTRLDPPTIGCKEITASDPAFTVEVQTTADSVFEPGTITFSAVVTGEYEGKLSYAWDFNGDGTIDSTDAEPVVSNVDSYDIVVVVSDDSGAEKSAAYASRVIIFPENRTFYAAPANVKARPPYATLGTAGPIADVYAVVKDIASAKIILGDGSHTLSTTISLTNGMAVTSLNGRDRATIVDNMYGDKPMFVVNDPESTISNLTIRGRSDKASWCEGACVLLKSGVLRNCIVTGWLQKSKGTISTSGCTAARPSRIDRCVIANFTAMQSGAITGVYLGGSGATMENCLLTNIVTTYSKGLGSALNCSSSQAVIRNCTFAYNDCFEGYPVHFASTPAVFENNIVYGNTTNGTWRANDLVLKDGNNKDKGVVSTVAHTCVAGGDRDYSGNAGVIIDDPLFVAEGDCHLTLASPCRNKGVNDGAYTSASLDLDGNKRLVGRRVDMGCYECQDQSGFSLLVR